jgi:hypothetical protein
MLELASLLLALTTAQAAPPAAGAPAATAADTKASPVSVTAMASKSEVTIGESFSIDVKATGPAGTTYTFAGEASADELELRTPSAAPDAPAPEPGTHRYEAAVFALGELEIPPIPVRYRLPDDTTGEAASAPLSLKVVSLLPKDAAEQKLADIRGPASVGIGRAFWWRWESARAVAALAILLLRRRRAAARRPRAGARPRRRGARRSGLARRRSRRAASCGRSTSGSAPSPSATSSAGSGRRSSR